MSSERVIQAKVKDMLSHYKLSKVSLDNLVYIIEDQGFEIIEYGFGEDSSANRLIERLDLTNYSRANKAFAYQCGVSRFVFVSEDMSAREKLYALAHEVGHIFCGHLKDGNMTCSVEEEYEANEFAHAILHPRMWDCVVLWIREHKKAVCAGALALLALCAVVIGVIHNERQRSYYGEYYITDSGHKYHEAECIFVKDKNNVERLTKEDYYSGEYEPCQICLPEHN